MNKLFAKLEQHLLDGNDIGIPVGENDQWELMDQHDNLMSSGDTLEEAVKNLNQTFRRNCTFSEVQIGESFSFLDQRWRKTTPSQGINEENDWWIFKSDTEVLK